MKRIEIDFAIDVELTDTEQRELGELIERIARRTAPPGQVHWLCSSGSKPLWSDADWAAMPDLTGGRSGKKSGEPEFDDSILHFSTSCLEVRLGAPAQTSEEPPNE